MKLNEKKKEEIYPDILGIIGRWQEEREGVSLPQGALQRCCAEGCLSSVAYTNVKRGGKLFESLGTKFSAGNTSFSRAV